MPNVPFGPQRGSRWYCAVVKQILVSHHSGRFYYCSIVCLGKRYELPRERIHDHTIPAGASALRLRRANLDRIVVG